MSDYTTQLRFICESYAGRNDSAPASDVDEVIRLARPKIFNFSYPIFDEAYRPELEEKILQHYYTQEIGLETVGLWKLKLRTKMREIMPYYNQLYKSELLKFDPFINTDYTDERQTAATETNQSATATHGETTGDSMSVTNGTGTKDHTGERHGDTLEDRTKTATTQGVTNTQNGTTTTEAGENTHTGSDRVDFEPMADRKTLTKHSDTPLGSVNDITAVGDQSVYLSDVSMTVDNYSGSNKKDKTTTTYGGIVNDSKTGQVDFSGTENKEGSEQGLETAAGTHSDTDKYNDVSTNVETTTGTTAGTENGTSETNSNGTSASDYAGKVFGKTGSETYSEMLQKFRDTFLNIDMDVINELNGLFMLVW